MQRSLCDLDMTHQQVCKNYMAVADAVSDLVISVCRFVVAHKTSGRKLNSLGFAPMNLALAEVFMDILSTYNREFESHEH